MKSSIRALFYAVCMLSAFVACEKDHSGGDEYTYQPGDAQDTIIYTINSEQGFSVDDFKSSLFPDAQKKTDFIVLVQRGKSGEIMAPMFSNPYLQKRFLLYEEFEDIESARAYFKSEMILPSQPMQQFAMNLKPNQLWLVQSANGSYSKILITETRLDTSEITPQVEIGFLAGRIN